jgi:hypothetical protein
MNVDLSLTDLVMALLDKYGLVAGFGFLIVYYMRDHGSKIDRLTALNNKTFGVMLALAHKRHADTKGDDDD